MEQRKEPTKALLAACFKQLVLTTPFDKLTIKMITDKAEVIRPTFYKHFQDKYEVIEWIFHQDITSKVDIMLENNMETEAIRLLFICMHKDTDYYRKMYQITGPNSFEYLLNDYIYQAFLNLLKTSPVKMDQCIHHLTHESIAQYYTFGLANTIKQWITTQNTASPAEICDAYYYIVQHSIFDLIHR